MYLLQ